MTTNPNTYCQTGRPTITNSHQPRTTAARTWTAHRLAARGVDPRVLTSCHRYHKMLCTEPMVNRPIMVRVTRMYERLTAPAELHSTGLHVERLGVDLGVGEVGVVMHHVARSIPQVGQPERQRREGQHRVDTAPVRGMTVQCLVLQRHVEPAEQCQRSERCRPGKRPMPEHHDEPRGIESGEQPECCPLDPDCSVVPAPPPRALLRSRRCLHCVSACGRRPAI